MTLNPSIQRTGASRSAQFVFVAQWRLAPAAVKPMSNSMKPLLLLLILCATSCARVDGDRSGAATVHIAVFKTALDAFQKDCGRFPSSAEGLAALTTRPGDLTERQWHGPYLDAAIPKDPWGHDYVYRYPGIHNTNEFDIYSCGPDGVSKSGGNDADDIANWPKQRGGQ